MDKRAARDVAVEAGRGADFDANAELFESLCDDDGTITRRRFDHALVSCTERNELHPVQLSHGACALLVPQTMMVQVDSSIREAQAEAEAAVVPRTGERKEEGEEEGKEEGKELEEAEVETNDAVEDAEAPTAEDANRPEEVEVLLASASLGDFQREPFAPPPPAAAGAAEVDPGSFEGRIHQRRAERRARMRTDADEFGAELAGHAARNERFRRAHADLFDRQSGGTGGAGGSAASDTPWEPDRFDGGARLLTLRVEAHDGGGAVPGARVRLNGRLCEGTTDASGALVCALAGEAGSEARKVMLAGDIVLRIEPPESHSSGGGGGGGGEGEGESGGLAPATVVSHAPHTAPLRVALLRVAVARLVDMSLGGMLTHAASGSAVALPPRSLVYKLTGAPFAGAARVSLAVIDVGDPGALAAMPGDFSATDATGAAAQLRSFGALWVGATDAATGEELEVENSIAGGGDAGSVEVTLGCVEAPDPARCGGQVPSMWGFDAGSGKWVQTVAPLTVEGRPLPPGPGQAVAKQSQEQLRAAKAAAAAAGTAGVGGVVVEPGTERRRVGKKCKGASPLLPQPTHWTAESLAAAAAARKGSEYVNYLPGNRTAYVQTVRALGWWNCDLAYASVLVTGRVAVSMAAGASAGTGGDGDSNGHGDVGGAGVPYGGIPVAVAAPAAQAQPSQPCPSLSPAGSGVFCVGKSYAGRASSCTDGEGRFKVLAQFGSEVYIEVTRAAGGGKLCAAQRQFAALPEPVLKFRLGPFCTPKQAGGTFDVGVLDVLV
jgi:hypothetical protein